MIRTDYTGYSFKIPGLSTIYKIIGRKKSQYSIEYDKTVCLESVVFVNSNIDDGSYEIIFDPKKELQKRLKNEIV